VVHDLAYADIVFDGYQAPSIMQVPGARDVAVEFFTSDAKLANVCYDIRGPVTAAGQADGGRRLTRSSS
jgi:hypothetical protein